MLTLAAAAPPPPAATEPLALLALRGGVPAFCLLLLPADAARGAPLPREVPLPGTFVGTVLGVAEIGASVGAAAPARVSLRLALAARL